MSGQKPLRQTRFHTISAIFLLLIVLLGISFLLYSHSKRNAEEESLRIAEQERLAAQTTEAIVIETEKETETESMLETVIYESPIDFAALAQVNSDVIGWIRIPNTKIDYPIVQTDNNDTYLHTDFDGKESIYGAIYLDFESDHNLMGFNNVLYGHNMKNGSMFKDVVKFKDKAYFNEHQFFEIYTPERTIRLKAVSCYYAKADGIVRKTTFNSQESFDTFVADRLNPCAWAEIPEISVDSLYVLVTCSYEVDDARTFLFAVEVDDQGEIFPIQ